MALWPALELGTAVGEDRPYRHLLLLVEGQHPVVQEVGSSDGDLGGVELAEGQRRERIHCGLQVYPAHALDPADTEQAWKYVKMAYGKRDGKGGIIFENSEPTTWSPYWQEYGDMFGDYQPGFLQQCANAPIPPEKQVDSCVSLKSDSPLRGSPILMNGQEAPIDDTGRAYYCFDNN